MVIQFVKKKKEIKITKKKKFLNVIISINPSLSELGVF